MIGSLEEYDKREQDREQKIDLLSKENDELKEVIISAEADILSLQRKCKEISEQSKQQSLQMNELNEALIQLRDINEESISHLDKAQEEIESLTNQIKEKERINDELNNNNNVLSNIIEEYKKMVKVIEASNNSMKDQVEELSNVNINIKKEIENNKSITQLLSLKKRDLL